MARAAKNESGSLPRKTKPSVGTLDADKSKPTRRRTPVEQRYVGIDLHRRRSVIVHKDVAGAILSTTQLDNDDPAGRPDPYRVSPTTQFDDLGQPGFDRESTPALGAVPQTVEQS